MPVARVEHEDRQELTKTLQLPENDSILEEVHVAHFCEVTPPSESVQPISSLQSVEPRILEAGTTSSFFTNVPCQQEELGFEETSAWDEGLPHFRFVQHSRPLVNFERSFNFVAHAVPTLILDNAPGDGPVVDSNSTPSMSNLSQDLDMNLQSEAEGPIQLPTKLVTRIFSLACEGCIIRLPLCPSDSSNCHQNRILLAPVVLSQVCRGWRQIALDAPSLWSNIFIDGSIRGIQTLESHLSSLLAGIEEVLRRTKAQAVRLVIQPPDLEATPLETNELRRHWQKVVDSLFGASGTPGFNCTRLHIVQNDLGLEDIDLGPIMHLTLENPASDLLLEDSSSSLRDWLRKRFTTKRVSCWQGKLVWLSENGGSFPSDLIEAFSQIRDLAIITPRAKLSASEVFQTFGKLPLLTTLRINPGSSASAFVQTQETPVLPSLRTLELQKCNETILRYLLSARLPALTNFDWVIAGFPGSSKVDVEGALAQNAPALCSVRVCYIQWARWSTNPEPGRPASFNLTSTAEDFKNLRESLSVLRLDTTTFLSNFTTCRLSPNRRIIKAVHAYIEEMQSMPYVGHNWKAELDSPASEVQARHIQIHPADILSLKRALKVLGSDMIPANHRSLEVVLAYPGP